MRSSISRVRAIYAFTSVEALIAVALVGLLMGGLMLSSSNVVGNLVQGSAAERLAYQGRTVLNSIYRLSDVSTAVFVTPTLNHAGGCDWDWAGFAASPKTSINDVTLPDLLLAHSLLDAARLADNVRDADPTAPMYDLATLTGRTLTGNGFMVWFVRNTTIQGVVAIEKSGASDLTVTLYTYQGNTLSTSSLVERYTVAYGGVTVATYRNASTTGYSTAPVDYALLQSVRQFGANTYGATGHYSGTLILLPNPYDLDASPAPTKISPQGLFIEQASPIFIYAHKL